MSFAVEPKWAKKGQRVSDKDGYTWVIKNTYVTGNYAGDWLVLQCDHVSHGKSKEFTIGQVTPIADTP
jgi:hypothetical protein